MSDIICPSAVKQSVVPQQRAMEEAMAKGDSDIQTFYSGATVFLTGGTGFIGKSFMEKLLRSTEVKKIFMLIRPKKGKNMQERLDNILKDPLYNTIKRLKPDFAKRIVCIEGDVGEIALGICESDRQLITKETTVIVHLAATTRFDELLRKATFINVRGTKEAINLAKACKNLRSFVHVSTAFAHATCSRVNQSLSEEFYKCPLPPEVLITMAESFEDQRLYGIATGLMKDWPNTYTFTKALAEELVRSMGGQLPICIVRPPYVACAFYDPVPGWLDISALFSISGIIVGSGLGVIHVSLNKNVPLIYAPVDYVSNAIMAAGWNVGTTDPIDTEPMIYNIANTETAILWENQVKILKSDDCARLHSPKCVWHSYAIETDNSFVHWLLTWILHYIPAYLIDGFYYVSGKKRPENITSFVHLYRKIYMFTHIFRHFLTNAWYFHNKNLQKLYGKMSKTDQQIYNFDIDSMDFKKFIFVWIVGLREFIVKDGAKDDTSGCRKQFWFKIANFVFLSVYFVVVWFILKFVYSCVTNLIF